MDPEQEREIEAREECARRGIDPDEICADGGVTAWMVVDQEDRPLSTRERKMIDQAWETHKAALAHRSRTNERICQTSENT